ncbi:DUF4336 domain-containing protein [Aestuariimicrobium ganziense]|uniref:DUF4336 domain-containing protein n=1 Tax=Aestuariimicrobium ganziense TaxID=2773677 RepID=UPI0019453EA2|nr:DUF4336 domain-containing protein [Aestuariimicrobium ganziense]
MTAALEPVGADLWVMDGPVAVDLLVVPYPTRMSIARLDDGGLWISSPIAATFEQLTEVAALGPVHHLLAPTPRHHWRLERWHQLFPDARLWSSPMGPFTLGRRRLPATTLTDQPPTDWAGQLDQACYRAPGFTELAFRHRPSRTLLLEDILQSHDHHPGRPLVNALVHLGGIAQPGGVPRDIRALTRDKDAARAFAEQVLGWDFDTVVLAHGPVIREDAHALVRHAFAWLLDDG